MNKDEKMFYIQENWPENTKIKLERILHIFKTPYVEVVALQDLSLMVRDHEFVAVMGASGCGKTTLIKLLAGLLQPTSGSLYIETGKNPQIIVDLSTLGLEERRKFRLNHIGYISQHFDLFNELTALENTMLPYLVKIEENGKDMVEDEEEIEARANRILEYVGIYNRRHHKIEEMSGGEKQRVAISAVLMKDPDIILADEPTGELDLENGKKIFSLFEKIRTEKNKTIVCVTHDHAVENYAARIINLPYEKRFTPNK